MIDKQYLKIMMLTVFISTSAIAQGILLQKGSNGLGVASGFSYGGNYYDFNGILSYTFNGILDLGFSINNGISKTKVLDDNLNKLSLSPFIEFIERSDPIILSVNLSYQHDFVNSDAFDILDIKASGDYYSVGSSIGLRTSETESFFIQPSISAKYIAGREKASSNSPATKQAVIGNEFYFSRLNVKDDSIYQAIPAGQTRSNFTQKLILVFGADFCFRTSNNMIIHITPNFLLDKDNNSIGINAGIVIPTTGKRKTKYLKGERIEPVTKQQGIVYINIENAMKKHFLVYMSDKTPMKKGDTFTIVRMDKKKSQWFEIGKAIVVKIQDKKVVLESNLYDKSDQVTTSDRIIFSY